MNGLLGNLFGIQEEDPLLAMLPPEQRARLQAQTRSQGITNLGLALLQAGGPTRTPGGFGQLLGQAGMQAMQANQGLMDANLQRMLAARKMQQEQAQLERQKQFRTGLAGLMRTETVQPAVMDQEGRPGAGVVQPAFTRTAFDQDAATRLALEYPEFAQEAAAIRKMVEPEAFTLAPGQIRVRGGEVVAAAPFEPKEAKEPDLTKDRDAISAELFGVPFSRLSQTQMSQVNTRLLREREGVAGAGAPKPPSRQPGFMDATDLRKEFRATPEAKAFQEMRSAYGAVEAAASQKTPVADVALATKIMKLLDPGSVVRESELAIAMSAAAPLDRILNYANRLKTGEKLTDTQREEFRILAKKIFDAAEVKFGEVENYYAGIARQGGLDPELVIGGMGQRLTARGRAALDKYK